jgi:alkanesulfonate monooxygenase SsuD/methylene tetrahydromethanopterin reductase-like flavin-dependent oxidoreductase (luciferase family)
MNGPVTSDLVQSSPPIMIAGMGDKPLAMAVKHADIISV